jgi:malate dehydrogenase (quinone)
MTVPRTYHKTHPDVILIGAGIMSATLGMLLKQLQPDISITIFERLDEVAAESSDAWNNAGTGHSAFCELNYTPEKEDGSIDISKAVKIAASFEVSKEFWAFLVQKQFLPEPENFIHDIPHISFVWGEANVTYLRKRYEAMKSNVLFKGMEYSEDPAVLQQWMPLVMHGRKPDEKVAATKMDIGTDVNFGSLTRTIIKYLEKQPGVNLHMNHEVRDVKRAKDGKRWEIEVKNLDNGDKRYLRTPFIFLGAGGGTLLLLEKADLPEASGYGGFPISGQWLRCKNPDIIKQHDTKVYGKASIGAPPMSVPHLDTRMIGGEKSLLFGPFAGFSTKFLKKGSYLDLAKSIEWGNIKPMLSAGINNIPLTKYLIQQVRLSHEDRVNALRDYLPEAVSNDWELAIAGQRVQVIKKGPAGQGGVLEFGTEVVASTDGSLAALLGASPGASTAVSIMLDVLDRCFPNQMATPEWQAKLKEMIPSFGQSLSNNPELAEATRKRTADILHL